MTPDGKPERQHLRIDRFVQDRKYKSVKSSFGGYTIPDRQNREGHGGAMLGQLQEIEAAYSALSRNWENQEAILARGLILEFEGPPNVHLDLESLAERSFGLELLNQRPQKQADGTVIWRETWFVPDGKLEVLKQIFEDYLTKERGAESPTTSSLVGR